MNVDTVGNLPLQGETLVPEPAAQAAITREFKRAAKLSDAEGNIANFTTFNWLVTKAGDDGKVTRKDIGKPASAWLMEQTFTDTLKSAVKSVSATAAVELSVSQMTDVMTLASVMDIWATADRERMQDQLSEAVDHDDLLDERADE